MQSESSAPSKRRPLLYTLLYAAIGAAYIFFSDAIAEWWTDDPLILTRIQTFKGLAYILLTALLVYLLMRRLQGALHRSLRALAKAEEEQRRIVETAREGVWMIDAEGRTTYANERMGEMLGWKPEEMLGRPMDDFLHDANRAQALANLEKRRRGISEIHEFRFRRRDGGELWAQVATTAFMDAEGRFEGALGMLSDITPLRRQQAQLRESEERYRLIANLANDAIWEWDAATGRAWWNQGCTELLGREIPDETFGSDRPGNFIHPDDIERVQREMGGAIEQGAAHWRGEARLRGADGAAIYVLMNCHLLRGADGALTRIIGGMTDITKRREFEQRIQRLNEELEARVEERTRQLATSEALYRTLTEAAPQVIWMADLRGEFIFLNRAWSELTGNEQESGLGWGWLQALHEEDRPRIRSTWELACRQGAPYQTECRFRNAHGTHQVVNFMGAPVRDEQGKLLCWVGVNTDITERKRFELQIQSLNHELKRRGDELATINRELESLSHSISHDLRAPLRHIDGFADLLIKSAGEQLDADCQRYLTVISKSVRQMNRMIEQLLHFSRLGRAETQPSRVNMDRLVADVIASHEAECEGREVEWVKHPLPEVTADRHMLRQVLVNLTANALKFTRDRETARIEFGTEPRAPGNHETAFYVKDNGAGFDMRYAQKLFKVFQRLHSVEQFEGIGVGLASVQRIITRHGGRTWAEGAVDRGATFYFTLPHQLHMATGARNEIAQWGETAQAARGDANMA